MNGSLYLYVAIYLGNQSLLGNKFNYIEAPLQGTFQGRHLVTTRLTFPLQNFPLSRKGRTLEAYGPTSETEELCVPIATDV